MLTPYRVLDLTDKSGWMCGQILGDLGADVIKVEKPGGDPGRRIGPFYHDIPDPEKSLYWFAYNTSKRGITLNLETADGQGIFKRLVKKADLVLESFPPGYMDKVGLGYSSLSEINPRIIMVSITPFGQVGPYKDYKGCDLVAMAMGGLMCQAGDTDRPPVRASIPQAPVIAGINAAIGALMALEYRDRTGEGQPVDVPIEACIARLQAQAPIQWAHAKLIERRDGVYGAHTYGYRRQEVWPCKDGYVAFVFLGGPYAARRVYPLIKWMNSEGVTGIPKDINWEAVDVYELSASGGFQQVEKTIGEFFLNYTKAELMEEAERRGFTLLPVNSPGTVINDPQLSSRNFWEEVEHDELGVSITYPGAPCKLSETPWRIRRRAPLIGEHNQEMYAELDFSQQQLVVLKKNNISYADRVVQDLQKKEDEIKCSSALEGTKVLDFTWVAAGPLNTAYLAAFGAQVIKIESQARPDPMRNGPPFRDGTKDLNRSYRFCSGNASKYSMALNMGTPQGVEIAKRLVAWADVVIENYSPGTMKKWGLAYEDMIKIKPDIIMLSLSMQGQTGPRSSFAGFGNHVTCSCGIAYLTGWPDRAPLSPISGYSDLVSSLVAVVAVVPALNYRRRTGKGQYIDLSEMEATIPTIAPALLDYTVNGREQSRQGNRSNEASPHGAYPCKGDDRWCVIAVFDDEEWENFCRVIGNPDWTHQPKFATFRGRKKNEDELDKLIAEWTIQHSAEEVMVLMQEAGVSAGVVQNSEDIVDKDPQLKLQGIFPLIEHPEMGMALHYGPPIQLSKSPSQVRAVPCLGEHTEQICREILGMPDEEFVSLSNAGVLW